jgi:hypothetical protein
MEAKAALASPEAANQTRDTEAQKITHNRNLPGRSSKDGKVSFSSTESGNPSEEAPVARRGPKWWRAWKVKRRAFDLNRGSALGIMEERTWLREIFRWVFRVENVEVNGDTDREAAIDNRNI